MILRNLSNTDVRGILSSDKAPVTLYTHSSGLVLSKGMEIRDSLRQNYESGSLGRSWYYQV